MGKDSGIQWTHHTFNPWWGCTRVSPGCENCYAETFAHRLGLKVWGAQSDRRFFGDKHWAEPLKWNRAAEKAGERHRVFCASMADVFEDRRDLDAARLRLFTLIAFETPHLDWLLLTKRPENMTRLVPAGWASGWPPNVWAGVTVEDQRRADERIPRLLGVPAAVRFLSCEPLVEAVDLNRIDATKAGWRAVNGSPEPTAITAFRVWQDRPMRALLKNGVDWVIIGGESGHAARTFDLGWARSIIHQCRVAGVAPFVKQLGEKWARDNGEASRAPEYRDMHGGTPEYWPFDLRVREFPVSR